jgi:hypothetical protein
MSFEGVELRNVVIIGADGILAQRFPGKALQYLFRNSCSAPNYTKGKTLESVRYNCRPGPAKATLHMLLNFTEHWHDLT